MVEPLNLQISTKLRTSPSGQRVVFVQIMPGIESLGLVMRDRFDDIDGVKLNLRSSAQNVTLGTVGDTPSGTQNGEFSTPGLVAVFIPFSYGFGGFTVLATPEKVRDAGIPADRALQLAITGWVKAQGGR